MTIPAGTRRMPPYAGDGSTTDFAVTFYVPTTDSITVIEVDDVTEAQTVKALDTDYTIDNLGVEAGSTVSFVTAPESGKSIYIVGDMPLTQPADFKNQSSYQGIKHEKGFDRAAIHIQEMANKALQATDLVTLNYDAQGRDIEDIGAAYVDELYIGGIPVVPDGMAYSLPDPAGNQNEFVVVNSAGTAYELKTHAQADVAKQSEIESGAAGAVTFVDTVADMKALPAIINGAIISPAGFRSAGDFRLPKFRYDSGSSATVNRITVHSHDTLPGRLSAIWDGREIELAWGGPYVDGTNAAYNATLIQDAIVALRHDPQTILDTIGGVNITAYASGTVIFPRGQIAITPDTIEARYDLGLTFKGQGSRRTNQSVRGATVLLITGTSSGWGIRTYRSGGRGFTVEDMDIAYATSAFTGDIFDTIDSPGVTFNRVYLGSNGISAGTRLQTARSTHRYTYEEFLTFNECVFDGAIDGAWSDDVRTELGNTFGGSLVAYNNCVFYDFTGTHMKHSGARTKNSMKLNNVAFNPINEQPTRCVDLNNIDGLIISAGASTTSTGAGAPSVEWIRLVNCTGEMKGHSFGDLSKAGTINGNLLVSGNSVFCTDGFTLTGGVIKAFSNEFSKGTAGYTLSPTTQMTADLGPDLFKPSVTTSYSIPADSSSLAGRINYDSNNDASTNGFSNVSPRVAIRNINEQPFTVTATPYTPLIKDTGRVVIANAGANQTFNLPESVPGTMLHINKLLSGFTLTVNCFAGDNFYVGIGAAKTTATFAAADVGGTIILEALSTSGWRVVSAVGTITWT